MYNTINNPGITGILQTIVQTPTIASQSLSVIFPSMIILTIWAILSIGSFFATTRRYGTANLLASMVIGGFVASLIGGILLIIPNFMPLTVIVISIVIEIVSFLIFLFKENTKSD